MEKKQEPKPTIQILSQAPPAAPSPATPTATPTTTQSGPQGVPQSGPQGVPQGGAQGAGKEAVQQGEKKKEVCTKRINQGFGLRTHGHYLNEETNEKTVP